MVNNNEIEKIKEILSKGYFPELFILNSKKHDFLKRSLPKEFQKYEKVYRLGFLHPNGLKKCIYFIKDETLIFTKDIIKEEEIPTGYNVNIICGAIGGDYKSYGNPVNLDNIIKSLKELKQWDIKKSNFKDCFEINAVINNSDRSKAEQIINNIEKILISISITKDVAFVIRHYNISPRLKHHPSHREGLWEYIPPSITVDELNFSEKLTDTSNLLTAAIGIQLMKSSLNASGKIALGWAAIEKIFNTKPTHILKKNEIKALLNKINELDFLINDSNDRIKKIKCLFKDKNLFSKRNRNERIAYNISKLRNEDYDSIIKKIKDITKKRGTLVHTIQTKQNDINEEVRFIEDTLKKYLEAEK